MPISQVPTWLNHDKDTFRRAASRRPSCPLRRGLLTSYQGTRSPRWDYTRGRTGRRARWGRKERQGLLPRRAPGTGRPAKGALRRRRRDGADGPSRSGAGRAAWAPPARPPAPSARERDRNLYLHSARFNRVVMNSTGPLCGPLTGIT